MWLLGAVQVFAKRLRAQPSAHWHRRLGYAFLLLWSLVVGPTSAYLSLTISARGLAGALGSALLLEITLLSYYFLFLAWRVARRRRHGAASLRLHGRLMSLGILTTMALLVQRVAAFGCLIARRVACAQLQRLGVAHWPHLLRAYGSDEHIFDATMLLTAGGLLALADGPRAHYRVFYIGDEEVEEVFGAAEMSTRERWAWRLRWPAYLLARACATWTRV